MINIIDIVICIACRDSAHQRGLTFDLDELQAQWKQEDSPICFSDYVINHLNTLCEVQENDQTTNNATTH